MIPLTLASDSFVGPLLDQIWRLILFALELLLGLVGVVWSYILLKSIRNTAPTRVPVIITAAIFAPVPASLTWFWIIAVMAGENFPWPLGVTGAFGLILAVIAMIVDVLRRVRSTERCNWNPIEATKRDYDEYKAMKAKTKGEKDP